MMSDERDASAHANAATLLAIPAALVAAAGIGAARAGAQAFEWRNYERYPDSLVETQDAWSAVRVEEPSFLSFRIAADDFFINEPSRITSIGFYSIPLNNPVVLGGDWYIYEIDPVTHAPGKLVAAGPDAIMTREDTGQVNQTLGPIYMNRMYPEDLDLDAGRYFLAFRSWISLKQAPDSKHAALTTRWANADERAHWNFNVAPDGRVGEPWVTMDIFNGVIDQEWAFEIRGRATTRDLALEGPQPGVAGKINRVGVRNGTPGERVYFFYGFERGETIVPSCGGLMLEIAAPRLIGTDITDPNGSASVSRMVPESAAGRTILLQAVGIMDCRMSQQVEWEF